MLRRAELKKPGACRGAAEEVVELKIEWKKLIRLTISGGCYVQEDIPDPMVHTPMPLYQAKNKDEQGRFRRASRLPSTRISPPFLSSQNTSPEFRQFLVN